MSSVPARLQFHLKRCVALLIPSQCWTSGLDGVLGPSRDEGHTFYAFLGVYVAAVLNRKAFHCIRGNNPHPHNLSSLGCTFQRGEGLFAADRKWTPGLESPSRQRFPVVDITSNPGTLMLLRC